MPESQPAQRKHVCSTCHARFSRLSHLQRHQLLHADKPQETFQCDICDKSFNRKDVYLRHHRGVHGATQSTRRTRRKKSCERCIRYKLKCSRELPCLTCKNRNVACRYDKASPPAPQSQSQPSPVDGNGPTEPEVRHSNLDLWPASVADGVDDSSVHHEHSFARHRQSDYRVEAGIDSLLSAAELNHTDSALQQPTGAPAAPTNHHHGLSLDLGDTPWPSHEGDNTTNPVVPDMYHTQFETGVNDTLDLIDFGLLFDGSTFQASRTDWLGAAADYSDRQTLGSVHLPSESPYDLNTRPLMEDGPVTSINTPAAQLIGNDTRGDRGSNKDNGSDWPHSLDKGGNESWPFDYTSNKGYRKIKLPPLRQVLEQTVGHRPVIEKATLLDLIGIFGSPYIPVGTLIHCSVRSTKVAGSER